MTKWLLLLTAIAVEVTASLALKGALAASWLYVVVVIGYVTSLVLLRCVLRAGMPLGVAYGIWGAIGVAGTAVASAVIFNESMTTMTGVGIVLVIAGVVAIELGAHRASPRNVRSQDP